jgi:hypothetical protein
MKKSMKLLLTAGLVVLCQAHVGTVEAMNGKTNGKAKATAVLPISQENTPICSICTDPITNPNHILTTKCNHKFCIGCFEGWFGRCEEKDVPATCPNCRAPWMVKSPNDCFEGANRLFLLDADIDKRSLPLLDAVQKGALLKVNQWIEQHRYLTEYDTDSDKTVLKGTAQDILMDCCNKKDNGETPLMIALRLKNRSIAHALVAFGYIDTTAKGPHGKSVAEYALAAGKGFEDIAAKLRAIATAKSKA